MTKFHYFCHQIIESFNQKSLFVVIRASIVFGFFVYPLLSLRLILLGCKLWVPASESQF